ncbi:MAG: toxin-antitoxin system YwqK family antitoxin, partial [Planctomycetota bacterium]
MNLSRRLGLFLVLIAFSCDAALRVPVAAAQDDAPYLKEPSPVPPPMVVRRAKLPEKYPGGAIRVEREVIQMSDNQLINHGTYVEYYRNGKKFAEGTYEQGVHDGQWSFWHENGQLCKVVQFDDGKPSGQWDVFRPDGTLMSKKSYRDGERHGKWITYFDDEKVRIELTYRNGQLDGKRVAYHPNGQKRQEVTF